jgi:hypothetical protein
MIFSENRYPLFGIMPYVRPSAMPSVTTILEEARFAGQALLEYAGGLVNPTVRLGVTG